MQFFIASLEPGNPGSSMFINSDDAGGIRTCLNSFISITCDNRLLRNSDIGTILLVPKKNNTQKQRSNHCISVDFQNLLDQTARLTQYSDLSYWISKLAKAESNCLTEGEFEHCIIVLKLLVSHEQLTRPEFIQMLKILRAFYETNERIFGLPFEIFYIRELSERIDIKSEFLLWTKGAKGLTEPDNAAGKTSNESLIEFPFCLEPEKKALILRVENNIRMRHELQDAFFRALFAGIQCPYLVLEVRREWIIADTLVQLESKTGHDLKKQLKVKFIGEEAVDEGGVQKEFFQLVMRELFDKKYGMFCSYPSSSKVDSMDEAHYYSWFPFVREPEKQLLDEYALVGKLLGLAIYNSVILDVSFPKCLYRKLLGLSVGLEDLQELDPTVYHSLNQLLNCSEEEFEGFGIENFSCLMESIDESRHLVDLKDHGSEIPLLWADRHEWVSLYADMILNHSTSNQFNAFKRGFDALCADTALSSLFRPEEVEELICGCPCLSFGELERVAQYDNGYHREHPYIKSFWALVHSMPDSDKRKLLAFTTGSDRIPVGGLSKLVFVISRNGPDSDRLPTAHTCFNVLLLCEYSSIEKLERMLTIAIQNYEGFGLI